MHQKYMYFKAKIIKNINKIFEDWFTKCLKSNSYYMFYRPSVAEAALHKVLTLTKSHHFDNIFFMPMPSKNIII